MDCGEVRENGAKYPNQRVVNIKLNLENEAVFVLYN